MLNARTDVFLQPGDRSPDDLVRDAVERGRAFLGAGAQVVFVPGQLDLDTVRALVDGIGERRVSTIAVPGTPSATDLQAAGVARVSFGPWTQRLAMTHLAEAAAELLAGGRLPDGVRNLT